MVKTIGNPLTWGVEALTGAGHGLGEAARNLGGDHANVVRVNRIDGEDIANALVKGVADAMHFRSDVVFMVLIYPVIGVCLAYLAFHLALLPLIFPLAAGFALIGPLAGIGLYELSRQKEIGQKASWGSALGVLRSRIVGPVLVLGLYLMAIFALWLFAAAAIHEATLGPGAPASVGAFLRDLFTTAAGWQMIVIGMAVGAVFAAVVLVISLTAFPMLIDRRVGLPLAVATSVRVARRNPVTVASWGVIVALLLALGSVPAFLGLIFVMPVLGHATWHLYRAAVSFV